MDGLVTCMFRLVGSYSLYAQELVQNGELSINEPLVDVNNRMLEVYIMFTTVCVYTYYTTVLRAILGSSKLADGLPKTCKEFLQETHQEMR